MPRKRVNATEARLQFLENRNLNSHSITELAERFSISRKTAHPGLATRAGQWIERFERQGLESFHEPFHRPLSCPWQTQPPIL